jgi:hypothetical protein
LGSYKSENKPRVLRRILSDNARVIGSKGVVELNDVRAQNRGWISGIFTYPSCLDGDALFVLPIEGVAKEADGEVERGCEHTVPEKLSGDEKSVTKDSGETLLGLGTEYGQRVRFREILCGMRLRGHEENTKLSDLEKVPIFQAHGNTEFHWRALSVKPFHELLLNDLRS